MPLYQKKIHFLLTDMIHRNEKTMKELPQTFDCKHFKQEINRIALILICYEAVFLIFAIIFTILLGIWQGLSIIPEANSLDSFNADNLATNGWPYLLSTLIATGTAIAFRKQHVLRKDLSCQQKPMRFYAFLFFLAFMMAIQLFNQFFSVAIESFLNVFGYSMAESMEALTEIDDTVSMFFYVVFIGPVAEEIVFRGVVLHSLKKYGKIFAIVISSLAFGLMHGNLYQLLFAFGIGLVLAYITLEYSFKWAVLLHILNNLIFGEFILFLTRRFSETVIARFQFFFYTIFFIFVLIVLFQKVPAIRAYFRQHRTAKGQYALTFKSILPLVYFAVNLLLIRLSITKLVL